MRQGEIEVPSQQIMKINLGLLGDPSITTKVLKRGGRRQKWMGRERWWKQGQRNAAALNVKMGEGGHDQGM